MKRLFLLALAVCASHVLLSQTLIPRFETLGVNDGLPHSSVYSLLQDKKGFMWFGTADGLCRYDGNLLQVFKYTAKYHQDVVNNFVKGRMAEDLAGNIWYCNETGIYKWDAITEEVARVRTFEKKEFDNVEFHAIYIDEKDCLWMFNIIQGIFAFNIRTGQLKRYALPSNLNKASVILKFTRQDETGNIWLRIGDQTDPYLFFNKKSGTYTVQLKDNPPDAIFFGNNRRVFAYGDRIVFKDYKGYERIVPKLIGNKKISFYSFDGVSDNYGRLWMTARGNGLFYYDEKNNFFREYHHDNSKLKSLPFDLTTCLFIDRNENLWIGIDGGGVAKLDLKQPKFNLYPLSEGDFPELSDYFTKCFYEDHKGRIWFGSQTNGLNIVDPDLQGLTNYHHEENNPASLPGNMVGNILEDNDGNILVGSSGGISLFHEKSKTFETIPIQDLPALSPLLNNFVYKMIQLKNGDLLAATLQGIVKITKDAQGKYRGNYFSHNRYLTAVATDVVEMSGDSVYVTLPGIGLLQLTPEANDYKLVNTFLAGVDLRSVRKDEYTPGYLWIGSGKGLIHFNTKNNTYRSWDEKDGIANSYVYGSLEDSLGNLWISTNKGLSNYNLKQDKFENYSFQDGLQSNEFNTQAFYKSKTGVFYFGGIRGFNWFRPGYVSKETVNPVAAITRIEINDRIFQKDTAYLAHHTITVPYTENDFSFQFAALDYTRPEANKVQFMLEGWDRLPVTTNNKYARYAKLPPGSYTLKFKVSNAAGVWSTEERIFITIKSPFWQRAWFIIAMSSLLLGLIIYMTYRISQQKARRKLHLLEKQVAVDAERNRISADMHDEIGSGITHIALLSELIQTQQKEEQELKKDINRIAVKARGLVQTMSEIIWALNPHNDTLENLLAYTREQSQQCFESLEMRLDIHFPEQVPDIKLSNAQRRNLYLVTREALNNAMKHSGATVVQLKLEIIEKQFCFSVNDNGNGINEKFNKPGSNGMRNMQKRMADIGGTIEWKKIEKGVSVNYCLRV